MGPPRPIHEPAYGWSPATASHASGWSMVRGITSAEGHMVTSHQRAGRATSTTAAAAIPGVVLCVAGGIVRIAAGIIRAAARLSRGIDCLTGVAAGEDKRCDHDRDAEQHGRFPTHWSRPVGRSFGRAQGKSAITRSVARGGERNKGGPSLLGRGLESGGGNAQGGQTIDRTF
jgi:hypothetical protein